MSDIRAILADALREELSWTALESVNVVALADAILSLPGVTTIALPAANFPDLPTEWFGERWTVWLDARRGIQIRDQGYEPTPAGARAFAAALLAAADAAEAANNG